MKKILSLLILGLMIFGTGTSFAYDKNGVLTVDQKDVIALMQSLYKIPPETFDFAEFDYDFKRFKGNFSKSRHNELLFQYFDRKILVRSTPVTSSKSESYEVPLRYPRFPEPNELMAENRSGPLPKIKVLTPEIDNDRAKVLVKISDGSICHYFLKKLPQGWRIYKVRSFLNPPNNLYLMKQDAGHMVEYPSGNQFWNDKEDMKLSEW